MAIDHTSELNTSILTEIVISEYTLQKMVTDDLYQLSQERKPKTIFSGNKLKRNWL